MEEAMKPPITNSEELQSNSTDTSISSRISISQEPTIEKQPINKSILQPHYSVPLVHLSLRNITYAPITKTVTSSSSCFRKPKIRKTILNNVTTEIEPYKLTAWMGPSGSGKTTLISIAANLLSNPEEDLSSESTILVNGDKGRVPKQLVGVVWQDELLLPNLTVEETITFAARLKTPQEISNEQVKTIVRETIHDLGLSAVQHSLIGGVGSSARGISGGERKRVSVAVELVARPSILLLDEPTSGLDATSAMSLMKLLKELASIGHSIVTVVHQPRTTIFEMFDSLLLMSKGRMVYSGSGCGAKGFFESHEKVMPLPPQTGIADWIMDTIIEDEGRIATMGGALLPGYWERSRNKIDALIASSCNETEDDDEKKEEGQLTEITLDETTKSAKSTLAELHAKQKFNVNFFTQLKLLTRRSTKQQRGERLTKFAALFTLTYTLFTALFWWRLPDDTNRIYERNSLLFFIIIAQSNSIVVASMTIFQRERNLLQRERAKKMYGVLPYFLAKTLSDMTNNVCLPVLYGAVIYWLANLRPTASAFFTFLVTYYLTVSTAQSMGLFFSIAIPNMQVSLMLAPVITLFLMIMGGFYIPLNNMHPGIAWASWLSFARYGFSALIVNEFYGRDVPCAEGPVSISVGGSGGEEVCPLPGEEVVYSMGIEGAMVNVWWSVLILAVMQVVLRVASYVLLRRAH